MSQDCAECPLFSRAIDGGCAQAPDDPSAPGRMSVLFNEGEYIVDEGKPIIGIHCIRSGKVAFVKRGEYGVSDLIVSLAQPGDIIGIPDMFTGNVHQNGALVLEAASACFIPMEQAMEVLKNDPSIMFRIMRRVCDRIHKVEQSAETLV
jgi:CRP-like cAMP-binding protein